MTTEKATYKSPIEIFINDVNYSIEQDILAAVSKYGIKVNKDELVKALTYDRQQYEEGYRNAMKQMPKWIPVSERLPVMGSEVLTTVYNKFRRCEYVKILYYYGEEYGWSDCGIYKVIAWMELPKPYEEEVKK